MYGLGIRWYISEEKNAVKYLLVHQDFFDRTLDAKELKTKDSKETVRAFLTMITKKKRPEKFGSTKEQKLLENLKDLRSWRNGSLLFNESDQGCICWTHKTVLENFSLPLQWRLWIQVLSRFVSIRHNPDFQKNLLDRLDIKENREFRLFVHSVQQASGKIWKPKFENGDRIFISKYDVPFSKRYKIQFTQQVFQIIAIPSRKLPTDAIKDERDEIIRCNFYQKELIKAI